MKLYEANWRNNQSGLIVPCGLHRFKKNAHKAISSVKGVGYMNRNPNYEFEVAERPCSIIGWFKKVPSPRSLYAKK